MSTLERTIAEALFDSAIRLAIVVLVAEIVTRRLVAPAPASVHRVWRLVAAGALILPLISAVVPVAVVIQPSPALAVFDDTGWPLLRYAVWLAMFGTAVGLCRLILGLASMRALVRASRVVSGRRRAWPRPVFLESDRIAAPVTFGLLQRYVALPVTWRTWDRSRRRAVLVHELSHVKRLDYAAALAAALLRSIWWWHPAAWIVGARLSLTAELACDARAGARLGPAAYAQELLAVVAESGGRRLRSGWLPGAGSRLSARIDALLASDRRPRETGSATGVAFAVVIVALAVTCAATSVRVTPLAQIVPAVTFDHDALHALRHMGSKK